MNKLLIQLHALTDKDFNPELVADLLTGVLKSLNIDCRTIEITKVADSIQLRRRAPRKAKG